MNIVNQLFLFDFVSEGKYYFNANTLHKTKMNNNVYVLLETTTFSLQTQFVFQQFVTRAIGNMIFPCLYAFLEERKLPPTANPLLKESVVSLAEKIRTQKVTAEEVVQTYINRIKEVNPVINALVDYRFEKAIEEARAVDEFIRSGAMSPEEIERAEPLLGVPFTAKEEIACEGLNWTRGLVPRIGKTATEDAYVVQRFKSAGAILIGVTNISEFCCWVESRNLVYGQTNNPYKTNRTAGGSSGGEASLISSCGSPVGIGSDIGGSLRIPPFYCGIYGHKLTSGLINTKGILFRDGNYKGFTMITSGTLTRYAVDLKPTNVALVLPEKLHLLKLDEKVDTKRLKYHYVLDPGVVHVSAVSHEIKDGMKKLVSLLATNNENGLTPQEVHIPSVKNCIRLVFYWLSKEDVDFPHMTTDDKGTINLAKEFSTKLFGQSDHTIALLLGILHMKLPNPSDSWAELETKKLREQVMKYLENDGILLFPSSPTTAPYHFQPLSRPYDYIYYSIFNILQLPVTQVPIGIAKNGLPYGIQVVAGPYQDRLCFAVAERIESLMGGWVPPFYS